MILFSWWADFFANWWSILNIFEFYWLLVDAYEGYLLGPLTLSGTPPAKLHNELSFTESMCLCVNAGQQSTQSLHASTAMLTSPVENSEEAQTQTHTAINPPAATRSAVKWKSITMLQIHREKLKVALCRVWGGKTGSPGNMSFNQKCWILLPSCWLNKVEGGEILCCHGYLKEIYVYGSREPAATLAAKVKLYNTKHGQCWHAFTVMFAMITIHCVYMLT